jgi:HlyD family secretion protein
MKNLWDRVKQRPWLSAVLGLALVGGAYFLFGRSGAPAPATSTVARATVTQLVSVTGKTKPTQEIELAFEKSGRIVRISANVGDRVGAGQILVQLDSSDLAAQLAQANASVLAQQARLDQLVSGSRPEDIEISKAQLAKAQQDLRNDYTTVFTVLQDAYAKADDAVRKQLDDLFLNDEQTNPQLSFQTSNTQKQINAEAGRVRATSELNAWKADLSLLTDTSSDAAYDAALQAGKNRLTFFRAFVNDVNDALLGSISLSTSTVSTFKTNVGAARTAVNAASTALAAQEQTIASQKITVTQLRNQLNLKLAGTAPEEIEAQRAQVRQAQASAANIQAQLSKTSLRSSFAGIVTKQEGKVGQIVTPNSPIAAVISDKGLEIEANVPEVDIGRVALGKPVTVTLDALPGETFRGTVASVEPAETVVEGVSTYKTTVTFDAADARVKSGMTANMEILVDEHKDALALPQRAVITRNGKKYVTLVLPDGTTEERQIVTGLRGQNGEVEIVSGLSEGDTVLRSAD